MDQKPGKNAENKDEYDVDIQSCSAMDCTGLIPSLPQSFAEVEHYNDLYQFLPEHVSDPGGITAPLPDQKPEAAPGLYPRPTGQTRRLPQAASRLWQNLHKTR